LFFASFFGFLRSLREEGREEGHEEGREEGCEEGFAKARLAIVRNLLAEGAPFEFVQKTTGLDMKTIQELSEQQ